MNPKKANKKLVLNKNTVANLANKDMSYLKGGAQTIDTCRDSFRCDTIFFDCTGLICECTFLCTMTCPPTLDIACQTAWC